MKVIAQCWTCGKDFDISRWGTKQGVKCDDPECGGFVISPSGKVRFHLEGEIVKGDPTLQLVR